MNGETHLTLAETFETQEAIDMHFAEAVNITHYLRATGQYQIPPPPKVEEDGFENIRIVKKDFLKFFYNSRINATACWQTISPDKHG